MKTLTEALDEENKRTQSVEGRLTTLLGLSSIAGTIVFGVIVSNLLSGGGKAAHLPTAIVLVGAFYLTLQICVSVRNAVAGLERRTYEGVRIPDYLPVKNESESDHLRTRMRQIRGLIVSCRVHANDKVTRMAVAQQAAKNFLGALLFLAAVAAYFSITPTGPPADLIAVLQQNRALYDTLRGPPGPTGPQGPPGQAAQPCQCAAIAPSTASTAPAASRASRRQTKGP